MVGADSGGVGDRSALGVWETSIAWDAIIDPRPAGISFGSSFHGAALASGKIRWLDGSREVAEGLEMLFNKA